MYPVIPLKCTFGQEGDAARDNYVWNQLTSLIIANRDLHENKVKKWRRLYKGIPREEKRTFPWENASNVVVQLIGTCVDELKARILSSIYEVSPLFVAQVVGDWDKSERAEEQRAGIEQLMTTLGADPDDLDLYRVESIYYDEAIKFGTAFIKAPYIKDIETQCVSIGGKLVEKEIEKYRGPRVEKVPFEKMLVPPSAPTLEQAEFLCNVVSLNKAQLEERAGRGVYDKAKINLIKSQPDRSGPSAIQRDKQQTEGINIPDGFENAEWDIYECWFSFWHNNKKYRIIETYHYKTKTVLKCMFNFYPDNCTPFKMARLGYTDDGIYGYGYCEMLEHYQEEVSTTHNQRNDNRTLANTAAMRVSRASKLDSIYSIYPGACIPAEKDELEVLQFGSNYGSTVQEENLTISLAYKRAGLDAGMSGSGGGTQNPRKGIYSAMGTFSVLQAGNRIPNLRTTDMRYAHIELGRLILNLYAHFGVGKKLEVFGKSKADILKALEAIKAGKLALPIKAATASINKELEKQNDMMLVNILKQHHMGIAQVLQAVNGPQGQMIDPVSKQYLMDTVEASNALMKHVLRNFGHDDTSRLLPEVTGDNNGAAQQQSPNSGTASPNGTQQPPINPVGQIAGGQTTPSINVQQ